MYIFLHIPPCQPACFQNIRDSAPECTAERSPQECLFPKPYASQQGFEQQYHFQTSTVSELIFRNLNIQDSHSLGLLPKGERAPAIFPIILLPILTNDSRLLIASSDTLLVAQYIFTRGHVMTYNQREIPPSSSYLLPYTSPSPLVCPLTMTFPLIPTCPHAFTTWPASQRAA